jgi:hypothetical protein
MLLALEKGSPFAFRNEDHPDAKGEERRISCVEVAFVAK